MTDANELTFSIHLRFTQAERLEIHQRAKADGRTATNWANWVVQGHLKALREADERGDESR
jgi:hypothetical protein